MRNAGDLGCGGIERIRDGIWSTRIPIPGNPLGYVLTYLFAYDGGFLVIDPGWHAPEAFDALGGALAELNASLDDVRAVVVTHFHPDHYGLADIVRRTSGAWVGLHAADAAQLRSSHDDIMTLVEANTTWLLESGAPEDALQAVKFAAHLVIENVFVAKPDRELEDGDLLPVDGGELRVVHTPGHTPGHICLVDERRGVLLTGDHVLPRITPNVGRHPLSDPRPLGDYLRSLDRLRSFDEARILPGHEWPFEGLAARIDSIVAHHDERAEETMGILRDGTETAWGLAERLSWSRPFSRLEQPMKRAALSEALAHLLHLEELGLVHSVTGHPTRWRVCDSTNDAPV